MRTTDTKQINSANKTLLGIENFIQNPVYKHYKSKNLGLITNQSAILSSGIHTWEALLEAGYSIKALFGPEHGFRGDAQDAVKVKDETYKGIPVYSLYGDRYKPEKNMIKGLDALLFDIQDVGSRYYTYLYTLAYSLEVAAENDIEFVVLDRPNPISLTKINTEYQPKNTTISSTKAKTKSEAPEESKAQSQRPNETIVKPKRIIEGLPINPDFDSFVGGYNLPNRYGLTVGEFAKYIKGEYIKKANLTVVPMKNYAPHYFFEDTHLPWPMPSPNIPTPTTALVYAGTCLFEGTNLSEGRGTTRPFEILGAPWINGDQLQRELTDSVLPGVVFSSTFFTPQFSKHKGLLCSGITIHVIDKQTYNPLLTAIQILLLIRTNYPKRFQWRADWENPNKYFIDKLSGSSYLRERLDSITQNDSLSETAEEIYQEYNQTEDFKTKIQKYVIY